MGEQEGSEEKKREGRKGREEVFLSSHTFLVLAWLQ